MTACDCFPETYARREGNTRPERAAGARRERAEGSEESEERMLRRASRARFVCTIEASAPRGNVKTVLPLVVAWR